MKNREYYKEMGGAIAVIGMSGAFPMAKNIDEYWQNILNGRECLEDLSDDDLITAGISEELYSNPNYVRRSASLESAKEFDSAFFGYTPAEARLLDPQHRLFLEHSWKCLEDGNIIPDEYNGLIGVFGGCSQNNYLLKNLINSSQAEQAGAFQMMISNDKDYLTTRVSYKLNLKGPSITMQTACSTSLTAIQQGCLSLLNYQSDMVLCGGASVNIPYKGGYLYQDGLIFSPDGKCRAFDAEANGTVFGDGVGVVLLKRLDEALDEGDSIYAIIRGSAINNDGSGKIGFTAPSVQAQSEVIATALAVAEVSADTIGYVEAHGTGTLMGDPIELAALTRAFRMGTDKKGFCTIGSVKPNIGHLDAAAGVAGFIKAVLILSNGILPPQVNYNKPNPELQIDESPFIINTEKKEWKSGNTPRRAGVNSLGVGGTNVHLILEEFENNAESYERAEEKSNILIFSAKSQEALTETKNSILTFIKSNNINIHSIAYTLQKKRVPFKIRDFVVVPYTGEISEKSFLVKKIKTSQKEKKNVVFLFTGQGSQYLYMGHGLYEKIPFIKELMDQCFSFIKQERNLDLKSTLFPEEQNITNSEDRLLQTAYTQPVLFILEYALSRYLLELGVTPSIFLGHSLGEYVAACLSGVFNLEDALLLVSDRGRIMQKAQKGSMISVLLSRDEAESIIDSKKLQISVINSHDRCVISGTEEAVSELKEKLNSKGIPNSLLKTSHAYHSFLMDNILEEFSTCFDNINWGKYTVPIISNLTGEILSSDKICNKEYWLNQLREPVNFEAGVSQALRNNSDIFLEVGPGNVLNTFVKTHPLRNHEILCLSCLRTPKQIDEDYPLLLATIGRLWQEGITIDWDVLYEKPQSCSRIPSYVFSHDKYWIDSKRTIINENNNQTRASSNSLNDRIIQIWCDVFGLNDINPEENFYDMGGHSVLATQLLTMLNKTFSVEIGLRALLMDPTPANSIEIINEEINKKAKNKESDSEITTSLPMMFLVQKGHNSKPPLFMVAGLYFNRYYHSEEEGQRKYEEDYFRYFSNLVKNIGTDQTIYGFRPKGIFLDEKPHGNVQEMAKVYIEAIKEVQPEGPYLIGGECIGGIIALEIAQQLIANGNKMKHLVLMDTFYPRGRSLFIDFLNISRDRIVDELSYPFKRTDYNFFQSLSHSLNRLRKFLLPLNRREWAYRRVNFGNIFYLHKIRQYRPMYYSDSNLTILANKEWMDAMSPTLEWSERNIKHLNIIQIPGTHVTRLTDYGHITGQHIKNIINDGSNE